jgi:hypothetical protein
MTSPEANSNLQACAVCGRWFVRHPTERICSMTCKLKAEENDLPTGSVSESSK